MLFSQGLIKDRAMNTQFTPLCKLTLFFYFNKIIANIFIEKNYYIVIRLVSLYYYRISKTEDLNK